MITPNDILDDVKTYLDISDTTLYDNNLLNVLIPSAITLINQAGVQTPDTTSDYIKQYTICVSYMCLLNMDFSIDYARIRAMYDSNVLALREVYSNV